MRVRCIKEKLYRELLGNYQAILVVTKKVMKRDDGNSKGRKVGQGRKNLKDRPWVP